MYRIQALYRGRVARKMARKLLPSDPEKRNNVLADRV